MRRILGPVRRIPRLIVLLLAFPLASCLELEQTIQLRADGSGTQHVKIGLTDETLAILQRSTAAATGGGAAAATPDALFDERRVRHEVEEAGLELRSFRAFDERQRRWAELEVGFRTVRELRRSPLSGTQATWTFCAGTQPGTILVRWYPQGIEAWRTATKKARELAAAPDDVTRAFLDKRRDALRGLDVSLHVELPGDVVSCSTNLTRDSIRRVTANIRGSDVRTPQELVLLLAPRYEIVFLAKDCTIALDRDDAENRPEPRPRAAANEGSGR